MKAQAYNKTATDPGRSVAERKTVQHNIGSAPTKGKRQRLWTPYATDYARWLFPLINKTGWGFKSSGMPSPLPANYKEALTLYHSDRPAFRRQYGRSWLLAFSKPFLQRHTDGQDGDVTHETYYFTGSSSGKTLVLIDIDCHGGETQGECFGRHLHDRFFPSTYWQGSTRGHHGYLVLDTQGRKPEQVNAFYGRLGQWLRAELARTGLDVGDVEVKGHIQHMKGGEWYCGQLAKMPRPTGREELVRLTASPTWTLGELEELLLKEKETTPYPQLILDGNSEEFKKCKGQKDKGLQPEKVCANPPPPKDPPKTPRRPPERVPEKGEPGPTSRHKAAGWAYVREYGRPPEDEDTLLEYIRVEGYFSPPWDDPQALARRRKDCERILRDIRSKYNPAKAVRNYNALAKELLDGHTVAYGSKGVVHWEDLSVFLSIIETAVIKDPNSDGSVPCDRIEKLWPMVARRKHFGRRHDHKKVRAMREFLVACDVLMMTDRTYSSRKAMKYTLGPRHPDYSTTHRILASPVDPELLYDGYLVGDLLTNTAVGE